MYGDSETKIGGAYLAHHTLKRDVSPYVATSDITVRQGATLTIEPGVTINFQARVRLHVRGTLFAKGSLNNQILMFHNMTEGVDSTSIRLVGGQSSKEGRVEVFNGHNWGTVCDDYWNTDNARVVCRHLGFGEPVEASTRRFGQGTGIIALANVDCRGVENSLFDCHGGSSWNKNNCQHSEDVGVVCGTVGVGYWGGIVFYDDDATETITSNSRKYHSKSVLENIKMVNAGKTINNAPSTPDLLVPAITMTKASPSITNVSIVDISHIGIQINSVHGDVHMSGLTVANSSNNGISGSLAWQFRCDDCHFHNVGATAIDITSIPLILKPSSNAPTHQGDSSTTTSYFIDDRGAYLTFSVSSHNDYTSSISTMSGYGLAITFQRFSGYRATLRIINEITKRRVLSRRVSGTIPENVMVPYHKAIFFLDKWYTSSSSDIKVFVSRYPIGKSLLTCYNYTFYYKHTLCLGSRGENVNNCNITGLVRTSSGIRLFGSAGVRRIINSVITGVTGTAIEMSGSANQMMILSTNVQCHTSSWQTGIRINTDLHMLEVTELHVTKCYKGLDTNLYGYSNVYIANSTFTQNSYRGAYVYSRNYYYSHLPQTLQQTSQLQVSHCTFSGTTDTALYVYVYVSDSNSNSVHVDITDNTFQQNLQALLFTCTYRDGYANIARNNFMNNNGKCCSGAMDINDNYYYSSSIHAPVIVENNVFTYNSGEYVVRLNTRASFHSSHQHVDSLLIFRDNELTNNSLSFLPTGYAKSTPNAVIVLTGTGYMSVYNNILDNQNASTELAVQVEGYSSLDTINVTLNWWGTTNEENIVEKIFDFDDRNHLLVAQYFPFLLSPSISHVASSSHPRSYPPFLNNNREVGGQLDTDFTLTASGGPYTVTRDVTVLANATLTVEAGAVLTILPYVGILIEGRILSKGTPDNPVTFTHIVNDAKNKSNSDTQLLVRFSEPVIYSSSVSGIIELQLNGLWYPLCYNLRSIDYLSFDSIALLTCQQLTDWNKYGNQFFWWWRAEWFPALGDPIVRDFWCPKNATSFNNCTFNTSSYAPHSKCLQVLQVECHCYHSSCYQQSSRFTQTNWAGIRFAPTSTVSNYPFNHKTPRSVLNHTKIIRAGNRYDKTVPSVQSIFRPPQTNGLTIKDSTSTAMEVSHLHQEAVISGVTIVGAVGDGLVIRRPRGRSLMVEYVTVNDVAGAGIHVYDFWSLLSANVDYESICSGQTIISVDPEEGSYVGMSQDDHLPGISCSVVMQGPPNTILSVRLVSLRLYDDDRLYIRDGAQSASSLLVSYSGYRTSSSNAPVLSSSNNIYIQVTTGQKTGAPGFALFVDVIPTTGQQPVVIIKSSSIHNSQYGVYFQNAYDDARIQNVTIMNVLNDGVYVYSHEGDVMVDNCTIAHTKGNGVDYRYGDGQQIVTNNRVVNVSTGIYLYMDYYYSNNFGCHSTLSNNFISQARKNAVLYRTYRNRRRQCRCDISHNFFESNEEGVYLQNDYNSNVRLQLDFTVSNNFFSNNSGTDLFLSRNGDWNGIFNIYSNTFEQHRVGSGGCLTLQGYTTSLVSTSNLFTHNRGTYVVRIEPQTLTPSDFVFTNNTMIDNYVTESDTYHRDGRSAVVIVSNSDRFLIKNNHFDNPRSLFELGVEIPVQSSQEQLIDVTNNYWGTTDENIIIDRIHDFGYCSRLASAQYFPFLTSKNGPTASPSVSATLVITRPNSIVRGRVSSNTILAASGSPYVVTGDITVLPGKTLTIESGVELKFTHNTGILVEGQLIAHGNDNSPILLRDDSFAIGDLQLEEGSLRLVDGSSQWRGRVEIFHNGNWGPVCAVHNYSDWWQWWMDNDHYNTRVICRELGYSNANWQWPYVDPTLETSTNAAWLEHVLCRGDEETLRQCINYDLKKTTCRYGQLVASCSSQNVDGHYKTHKSVYHWTGVRFSAEASGKSSMRNVIISNAGIANAGHIAAFQNVGANVELFNVVVNKSAWTGIEVSHSPYINISQLTVEGSDGNGVELINTAASSITHLTSNNNVGHGLVIRVDSVLQRMWDIPVLHKQIVDICSVSKLSAASSFFLRFIATPISRGYSTQSCSATIDATSQHVISVHIMAIRFQESNSYVTIDQQNVFRQNRLEPNYPLHYTSQSQTITVDVRAEFTDERYTLEDNYFLAYIQQHPTG